MIYSVAGILMVKADRFVVVETGGLGLKLFMRTRSIAGLPGEGMHVKLFSHFQVREDGMDLYGFTSEEEREYFELLISVSGVGPKSALSILDVATLEELSAAIKEGRPDLLTRASGIGTKIAERIIIDLRSKVQSQKSGMMVQKMEADADLVEALSNLGYRRDEAKVALGKVGNEVVGVEDRLKAALKILGKR